MDIESDLRRARENERNAQLEAVKAKAVIEESTGVLQRALSDFRDALVRNDVPRFGLVVLNDESIPERRGLFSSTPSYLRMTAKEVGACWRFYGLLIFDNGVIRNYPHLHAGIGTRIIRNQTDFRKRADKALQAAGLGSSLSEDHLYLTKGAELTQVDWSTIQAEYSSYYQRVDFYVNTTRFTVREGGVLIHNNPDSISGVPFGQEAAEFITAGGRLRRAIQ